MKPELDIQTPSDGSITMGWQGTAAAWQVLLVRTGARPAYTSLLLDGALTGYRFANLSRHQRYRVALLARDGEQARLSSWHSVTPRAGLAPLRDTAEPDLSREVARVGRLLLMPQDRRLTAYWDLGPGFADRVEVELSAGGATVARGEVEPEVHSLTLSAERGHAIENGTAYTLRLSTRFAALAGHAPQQASATPALRGQERAANAGHDPAHLVYPSLEIAPEVALFPEDARVEAEAPPATCGHCSKPVRWDGWVLRCEACRAEYIANDAGDYLELARLRFGTCQCCMPRRILIQPPKTSHLVCVASGKEHLRLPGARGFCLVEDLPFGLCQCCRPRQPLERHGDAVRCLKSHEPHRSVDGRWALCPTEAVFDARAIDALLDAGLAEISQGGVSRGRKK